MGVDESDALMNPNLGVEEMNKREADVPPQSNFSWTFTVSLTCPGEARPS